ncbi:MAG: Gfo/Idh/MocA family oxidoreductase, partial [Phaeodactylibacter sp.]|nr:Gfo/Idh/MocA family oxidoreductase [Phaeodactylibacter sp.]
MKKINWGLIGPGKVTHAFVKDLQLLEHSRVSAVASRNVAKAEAFAEQYDIPNHYGSYAELFQDEEVDIVYIATPPHSHAELGVKAMEAGKHALIETPLAINSAQTKELIEASQRNGVFMMEAFWVRF